MKILGQPAPHARTLRKAREQVRWMIIDGFLPEYIRNYLSRWLTWWVITSEFWEHKQLLDWFIDVCRDHHVKSYATELLVQIKNNEKFAPALPAPATMGTAV